MVWFFSRKSDSNVVQDHTLLLTNEDKVIDLQKQQKLPTEKEFRLANPLSIEQIETNIFKSCVSKCLKQNNSNLQKTDSIHVAVYHCMEFCGEKWQNAIQLEQEMRLL